MSNKGAYVAAWVWVDGDDAWTTKQWVERARLIYGDEGGIEVDDNATVSLEDDDEEGSACIP